MNKTIVFTGLALLSAGLTGCIAEPYPYNGGPAPYYGTSVAPGYAYGEVGYFPYYRSQHIYSGYNNGYWHHQSGVAHSGGGRGAPQGAAQGHGGGHGGGGHGDGGRH